MSQDNPEALLVYNVKCLSQVNGEMEQRGLFCLMHFSDLPHGKYVLKAVLHLWEVPF